MWNNQQSQENILIQLGVFLFFLGLIVGFLVPALPNPRMGLASHLEGIINGIFLIVIGSIWSRLVLAPGVLKVLFSLLIYGTFANWLATLLAAIWGAGRSMPIAAQGQESTASKEIVVDFLLYSLSLAMLASCVILLIGLRGKVR
ncbi:MAG: hydrogenase [Gammaproteobacteria bacterium]